MECLDGGGLARISCSQEKNPVDLAFSDALDRRKQCRHGLADAGGCLDDRLPAVSNCPIYLYGHGPLPGTIRCKRKIEGKDGVITNFSPSGKHCGPHQVTVDEVLEKDITQADSIDNKQLNDHLGGMGFLWDRVNKKLVEDEICFNCKKKVDFSGGNLNVREASKVDKGVIAFVGICNECLQQQENKTKGE